MRAKRVRARARADGVQRIGALSACARRRSTHAPHLTILAHGRVVSAHWVFQRYRRAEARAELLYSHEERKHAGLRTAPAGPGVTVIAHAALADALMLSLGVATHTEI